MIDVRTIARPELRAWIEAMQVVYFGTGSVDDMERYRAERVDFGRTIGAFDGDRVVGTFRSFPTELTVPGGAAIPADAVTNVAVLPTHRRQGILNRMMAVDLRAAVDRGDVAAILFASEAQIYGRYGYGVATEQTNLLVRRHNVQFRQTSDAPVELVSWQQLRDLVPAVYERFRCAQPGSIAIDGRRWDATFGTGTGPTPFGPKPGDRAVVCRDAAGVPQGWLRYRADEKWEESRPASVLTVHELIAATPEAYARLWRFATEVDLVSEIVAEQRPAAETLPWLLVDRRAVRFTARHDGLWLRVLDTPKALAARRYLSADELVIEVSDADGFAGGRFLLEGGPHGAHCARTRARADLLLGVEALAAVYLGGARLTALAAAGLVQEGRPGAITRADAMFGSEVAPWSCYDF